MAIHASRLASVGFGLMLVAALPLPAAPPRQDCHGDPLPDGAIARMGTTRLRHSDGVCRVVYSPDGKLLASLSRDRTLRVWEAASGRQLQVFSEKNVDFYAVAWSPDGLTLAAAGDDPLHGGKAGIRFFDLQSGKATHKLDGHNQSPYFLAFGSDGKTLVSVSPGQVVRWDTITGQKLNEWNLDRTAAIDISPDRKMLAWVDGESEDRIVHLCDTATGKEIRKLKGHQRAIVSVAFSADGSLLASGNPFEPIILWDVHSGQAIGQLDQQQSGMHLRFSTDGKTLVGACMEGGVRRWNIESGKELAKLTGYRGWVNELAITPDGKSLALAGADSQVIHLWDLATGKEHRVAPGHRGQIHTLAFSPDGLLLATGGGDWNDNDQTIYLWETATGKEIRRLAGHSGKVASLCFSPDGKRLISGSDKEVALRMWDVATGKQLAKFTRRTAEAGQAEEHRVSAVAWSPDGRFLVSAHDQGILVIWDADSGTELSSCKGHDGIIQSVTFSPDGGLVLSGSMDRTVRVWDTATGQELRRLGEAVDSVKCVVYSPDGRLIAASSGDFEGLVSVWDALSGREIARLQAPGGHVSQVAFSPDGKLLAGTGAENALCVWEIATRTERCRFPGHPNSGLAVAFSPDGRTIASGSQDTTVLLWEVAHCSDAMRPWTDMNVDQLWTALGSGDAKIAHQAVCALVADPEQAGRLLAERLRPLAAKDTERLAKAVTDLDNDRFQVREKATNELARLGELAEPLLRQTLERQPSLEVRQRVQLLLNKLETATLAPDQLRTLRAYEVLERIGGNEARRLFEAHARQLADSPLGREAQGCLDRLARRQP